MNRERLRQIADGDAGLERELLLLFRNQHPGEAGLLWAAIDAGDFDAAAKAAHRISGAAGTVAAQDLGMLSESIGLAARRGEREEMRRARPRLECESRRVTEYLWGISL